jgi:hypothetical protein
MANSLDLQKLSLNVEFKNRVKMNLIHTVHQIVGELDTTPDTLLRQKYAVSIVNNPDNFVVRFSESLSVQAGIAQNITINEADPENPVLVYGGAQAPTSEFDAMDLEIQSHISAIFNDLAGVKSVTE